MQDDKLWLYFKRSKAKPKKIIEETPDKTLYGLSYLLLLTSVSFKGDFADFLLECSKLYPILTSEVQNDLLNKSVLISQIVHAVKHPKRDAPDEVKKIIQQLGKSIKVNALVKYIINDQQSQIEADDAEFAGLESKYIEILESNANVIDYSAVENLFNSTEIKNGTAETLYNMILELEQPSTLVSVERKINRLFEKKLIIPITDEFLRYHKDSERIDTSDASKKIDKVRYTVSKLHQIMNHYSNKQNTANFFYPPLVNKKVILYNDTDEINAIMKLVKMGKTAIRSNDNFSDLVSYREYPFLNFNDFKKYGFKLKFNQTTDAVRLVNFEHTENQKIPLQWRVAGSDFKVNIVGLALPRHIGLYNQAISNKLQCTNMKNTKDLHKIYKNGYDVFVKKLEHLIIDKAVYQKMGYWIFDKDTDKIKFSEFSEMNDLNFEKYFKLMTGSLYDKIIEMAYFRLKQMLYDDINIYDAINLINQVENEIIPLHEYLPYIYQDIIYEKSKQYAIEYDTNEDKIPGLNTKIKKVPKIKTIQDDLLKVTITTDDTNGDNNNNTVDILPNTVCQHVISWNNIRKNNKSSNYNQMLFEFIKRYVRDSANNEYVCKSCFQVIDIKKYVHDYSSSTEGVSMSFALESQLDKLPEYDKFNKLIKYMDKIIERFAYVANIAFYVGNLPQIKLRRQEIIRRVIDFINIQYTTIKNVTPAERTQNEKIYGISDNNLFFIFELKNEILAFSSKDTDKFKPLKQKNIYVYMVLFTILELNISQIYYLDEIVKFADYRKNKGLFDNLKIYINNAKEMKHLSSYPILCYCIYMATVVLVKSKLWNDEPKMAPRYIVSTLVYALNTLLEVSTRAEKDYRYELFATNFFTKLQKIYRQETIFDTINVGKTEKQKVTHKDIPLTGEIEYVTFDHVIPVKKAAFPPKTKVMSRPPGMKPKEITDMEKELLQQNLYKLFNIYNLDGSVRPDSSIPSDADIKNVTMEQLDKMYHNIMKKKKAESDKVTDKATHQQNKINQELEAQKNESERIQSKESLYDTVDDFIKAVEAIIGSNVNLNNSNLYLTKNTYTVHHDVKGQKLKEPLVFMEGDKNMSFKKNDNNFNADIYICTDPKSGVMMFYHGKDLYFLGYRDTNGKMHKIRTAAPSHAYKNAYLQINYSIMNKLLFLGFTNLYINMNQLPQIQRNRITNLKNILLEIPKLLYQVKNKYKSAEEYIKEYVIKFKSLEMVDDEYKIFGTVNDIINGSFYDPKRGHKIKASEEVLYARYVIKHDNADHDLIKYMCKEMTRLLDVNKDKYNKVNLGFLLMTIIHHQFNRFFIQTSITFNDDVKLSRILAEFREVQLYDDDEGIVDRLIEQQDEEARIDNIEEADALDATQEAPDENDDMGDEDVMFMPDV